MASSNPTVLRFLDEFYESHFIENPQAVGFAVFQMYCWVKTKLYPVPRNLQLLFECLSETINIVTF